LYIKGAFWINGVDEGDKEWRGKVGLVTTTLDGIDEEINIAEGISVVCGPPVMMKFTTLKLLNLGCKPENIYLSMEQKLRRILYTRGAFWIHGRRSSKIRSLYG